jgi:hypothetical protein
MSLWQSVVLEEYEWDVNQQLILPVDYVFKYCLQKKEVLVGTHVYIFFKCLILNDESRKINTLLFTVFNER